MKQSIFWASVVSIFVLLMAPARAGNILFVVNAIPLNANDNATKAILTGLGHTVTDRVGTSSVAGDTAGQDLIFISGSVTSTAVAAKFRNVLKPVMSCEVFIWDDMNMTGVTTNTHLGRITGTTAFRITMEANGHPMTAGLTGTLDVYTAPGLSNDSLAWGVPGTGAQNAGTIVGTSTQKTIFGYPIGATMVGLNAPGRRVGFFMEGNGPSRLTNPNGQNLLREAVKWALAPDFSSHPANATVTAPTTATFTVVPRAMGPLTYQWKKNGVDVTGGTGATTASYTTPATTTADNGAVYTCQVTNASGTGTSNGATLTVNGGSSVPVITSALTVTARHGTTFSYTLAATGSPTPTLSATALPSWATFTSPTLSGTPVNPSGTVTASLGAVNTAGSDAKTLTINFFPTITSAGTASGSVGVATTSANPLYTVTATGTITNMAFSISGTPALPAGLTLNATTGAITGTPTTAGTTTVNLLATNSIGTSTAKALAITITSGSVPPTISTQPFNANAVQGQTATFTVAVGGSPTPTVQWQKEGVNLANGGNITGATSLTLSIANATGADNGKYRAVATNGAGSATSLAASLNVGASNSGMTYGDNSSSAATAHTLSAVRGNVNSGDFTTLNVSATSGATNSGFAAGIKVTAVNTGTANSGALTGLDLSATNGPGNSTQVTGIKIAATNGTGNSVPVTGLSVTVSEPGTALPAYAAAFMGGRVGIGTTTPTEALEVVGKLKVTDMVTTPKWKIPDYVFEKGYAPLSLQETEAYVKNHKHLPGIPSAKEIEKDGMSVTEMNLKLLKTVEEMTLHMIEMDKELKALKTRQMKSGPGR